MKASKPTSARTARRLRDLWIYVLLIGGSAIFMWPFLWMATASVKLDREHFSEERGLLPQRPVPRPASPYVEERRVAGYGHARLEEQLPHLVAELRARAIAWPEGVDAEHALGLLGRSVFRRLAGFAAPDWWELPEAELASRLSSLLTPSLVEAERAALGRGLVFGHLVAQSYDLEEQVLVAPEAMDGAWEISGPGRARLLPVASEPGVAAQGRLLAYDLTEGDRVRLAATFTLDFAPERLHRLQLALRADDTWHALHCFVEMGGRRYRAERASDLGDSQWTTIFWQPPGPDDLTNKQKVWTLLRDEGPAETHSVTAADGSALDAHRLTVVLELERRGFFGAWWAKIARNYRLVFEHIPFGRYVATSLFLVILQIVATLFSCSLVAYSFARLRWPGRGACFLIMLGTMMLPSQVTMIPQFLVIRGLGWYNTLLPLWAPALFANAFYVFLLCQFMRGIPRDLEEAARIDGCGVLRIYWHVMLPMVRPTLVAISIFTFMGVWNDFMGPLIYLQDQRLYPLSLGLYALNVQSEQGGGSLGLMMAGSFLMTLPVIAIFFFAQRYFIRGIAMTGMKG